MKNSDYGPSLYVTNVRKQAVGNTTFRTAIWTGNEVQMTIMHSPCCGEIGMEVHECDDQLIRIECGRAMLCVKGDGCMEDIRQPMSEGDVAFIPMGTWHNIVNTGNRALKVSSIYAPPHHPRGTVHRTKWDVEE